jgi:putative PIN family toxin of toxin-antitoxin system
MAFDGGYELAISEHIVGKVADAMNRPQLRKHLSAEARDRVLTPLEMGIDPVKPDLTVRGIAPDPEDDPVLGTAVAAKADFLVTGDKGLLVIGAYAGVRIVTADAFLHAVEQE